MKTLSAAALLILALPLHAELLITAYQHGESLTWINSASNAVYQVQSAPYLPGPWLAITNLESIPASNTTVTVQLPPPGSDRIQLFRVAWVDAPAAQPVGTWEYRGFDPDGSLSITGLVSIASSNPLSGTAIFQAVVPNPRPTHPIGSGPFESGSLLTSNKVQIPLPTGFQRDNFRISGQMVLDEYVGWWFWTDIIISINDPGRSVTHAGRFSARRVE